MDESEHNLEKRIKDLIREGLVKHVKMFDDRSIEVKYAIKSGDAATTYKSNYPPDDQAYPIIISLVGELNPGDLKICSSPLQSSEDLEIQRVLKPASVAFGIENGDVEKVKRLDDGGICLWMIYDREKPAKELIFSSDAPHIETILKYTGPLKPGETYVFDRLR